MKKVIIMLMAALLVTACATLTPEEKAARDAAIKEGVKAAVASQKFKINVTSVTPMRAASSSSWTAPQWNVTCPMPVVTIFHT